MSKEDSRKQKSGKTMNRKQKKCAAKAASKDQGKTILYNYTKYKAHADPTHTDLLLTLKQLWILKLRFLPITPQSDSSLNIMPDLPPSSLPWKQH